MPSMLIFHVFSVFIEKCCDNTFDGGVHKSTLITRNRIAISKNYLRLMLNVCSEEEIQYSYLQMVFHTNIWCKGRRQWNRKKKVILWFMIHISWLDSSHIYPPTLKFSIHLDCKLNSILIWNERKIDWIIVEVPFASHMTFLQNPRP